MSIDLKRRTILQGTLAAGALGAAVSAGLILPSKALAAWPKDAFHATEITEALRILVGSGDITQTEDKIEIKAPDIAEAGTAHIRITSYLPETTSITLFIPNNTTPLIANFNLGPGVEGAITTRIQMATSGEIHAVIMAKGKLHSATKKIRVLPGNHTR